MTERLYNVLLSRENVVDGLYIKNKEVRGCKYIIVKTNLVINYKWGY